MSATYLYIEPGEPPEHWTSAQPPDAMQWTQWSRAQLLVYKIEPGRPVRVLEPHDSGHWIEVEPDEVEK